MFIRTVRTLSAFLIISVTFVTNITIVTPVYDWNLANAVQSNHAVTLEPNTAYYNHTISSDYINNNVSCNCVVFRMDDLQDDWIRSAQLTAMNLFLSKNIPLSLGLIMNSIGNDSKIIGQINLGREKGLFELALHGWNHVNYATLSEQEQRDTLKKANDKMLQLFGNKSNIFITPYGPFNNDTIKAMGSLGIHILSAALVNEGRYDNNASIAIANGRLGVAGIINDTGHNGITSNNHASLYSQGPPSALAGQASKIVYHLPAMSLFYDDQSGKPPIKTPIWQILAETKNSIKKYGYSVIVFHPQDLVERDDKGNVVGNGVYLSEVNDLSRLIDSLVQQRIRLVHFSTVMKYIENDRLQSTFSLTKPSLQCSYGWSLTTYYTPLETDFNGSLKTILAINEISNHTSNGGNRSGFTINVTNNNSTYSSLSTFGAFLAAVQEYGWGKNRNGSYLGYYDNQYHLASRQLNSIGKTLNIGDVAVDPSIIPLGTKVTLPTIPAPWNKLSYTASDTGSSIKGKHISVYMGEGKIAKKTDSAKSLMVAGGNGTRNENVEVCHF